MRRWDINSRVLMAAVAPAAAIAVALAWYFTYTHLGDLERQLLERGQSTARQLAPACEYGVFSGNREFLRQMAESAAKEAGIAGVAVVDGGALVLARAGGFDPSLMPAAPLPGEAHTLRNAQGSLAFVMPIGRPRGAATDDAFTVLRQSEARAEPIGAVAVQVSMQPYSAQRRELILRAGAITLAGLLVAAALARHLSKGVTEPVLALARTVAQIKRGDLDARARVAAGGALKALEADVNAMAASLKAARTQLEARVAEATVELQRQKERAEQANRVKTQFLATASHDLRQPIQAVGLFVSGLRLRAKDADTLHYVERIERALGGAEVLLDALLDISRLDAGAVSARIEVFPLARVFAALRDTFSATAAASRLELRIVPTKAWCRSDPRLLERVLSNLVSNALRYTAQGRVIVGCRRRSGALRIEVHDSGIGIPKDKQEEIFREFVQVGAPQRKGDKGLGLGLAIVERLTRLLGHKLALRSELGRGSIFMVTVARAAPTPATPQPALAAVDARTLAGRKVLIVDDDLDVLEGLGAFLSQIGAAVITAESLEGALRALTQVGACDLVISDFRLEGGADGVMTIHRIREALAADTPGVIITGESSKEAFQRIAESGLPLLNKPVRPEALGTMLAGLLQGRPGG